MSNGLWWLLALYHHCQAVSGVTALNSRFPSDDSRHVLLLAAACAGSGRGRKGPRGKHLALPQHTPSCLLRTLAPPERVFAPAARAAPAPRGAGQGHPSWVAGGQRRRAGSTGLLRRGHGRTRRSPRHSSCRAGRGRGQTPATTGLTREDEASPRSWHASRVEAGGTRRGR